MYKQKKRNRETLRQKKKEFLQGYAHVTYLSWHTSIYEVCTLYVCVVRAFAPPSGRDPTVGRIDDGEIAE